MIITLDELRIFVMSSEATRDPVKKHVSTACTSCRQRKIKCDGQTPACLNCKLYKQECIYMHDDKRKLSRKKNMQPLKDRIAYLESVLRSHHIDFLPNPTSDEQPASFDLPQELQRKVSETGTTNQVDLPVEGLQGIWSPDSGVAQANGSREYLGWIDSVGSFNEEYPSMGALLELPPSHWNPILSDPANVGAGQSTPSAAQGLSGGGRTSNSSVSPRDNISTRASGTDYESEAVPSENNQETSYSSKRHARAPGLESPFSSEYPTKSLESEAQNGDDDVIDQLSARIGAFKIAEDGQLRYFGATSNLHIVHNGTSSLARPPCQSIRVEGQKVLRRAGIDEVFSPEVERYLEELYFKWEDPAIHVVDEEMYFLEKERYNAGVDGSPFYSETLKNAICAVGAKLNPRSDLNLPLDAAEYFNSRTKALLDVEMDSPSVATVQALVIMSAIEAAFTRDARGWLYSGMAVRLSADLGLHLDLSNSVEDGIMTAKELDVRQTTFWGVFVHDSMWSLYVGRPWGITIRDISIPRPTDKPESLTNKQRWWYPEPRGLQPAERNSSTICDPIDACADANVSLCMMMRQLSHTVYSGRVLSNDELQKFATDMRLEFKRWQQELPPELVVDMSQEDIFYLPHILQLHMQFHAISILLHRPLFSRGDRKIDKDNKQFPSHARSLCISAAQSIVRLLRLYRKHHTLQRCNVQIVHLIFTASLICVYNAYSSIGVDAANALDDLQFCCQALGEIGKSYRNATRALEVIICIKSDWFRKASRSSKFKRLNPIVAERGNIDIAPRKRRVTEDQIGEYEQRAQTSLLEGLSASIPATHLSMAGQQNLGESQDDMEHFQNVNGMPRGESLSPKFTLDDLYASEREYQSLGNYGTSPWFDVLNPASQDRQFQG
ncbi:fungal-specific transcription factor domain-containing protein [Xylogone sp. PMI_703]|nr:fungal-specific transcription factor domain-containing protein [Xylogone sp. PMI_703]